jgi:hypothetical protein
MILTVISDVEADISLAGLAAVALCGAGVAQYFDTNIAFRPNIENKGGIDVMCVDANGSLVRAGFLKAGFTTVETLASPVIAPKANIVTVTSGPENTQYLQMADPAADALCGAGLTVPYPDGRSYSGDLAHDAALTVQCASTDAASVRDGFNALWAFLANA